MYLFSHFFFLPKGKTFSSTSVKESPGLPGEHQPEQLVSALTWGGTFGEGGKDEYINQTNHNPTHVKGQLKHIHLQWFLSPLEGMWKNPRDFIWTRISPFICKRSDQKMAALHPEMVCRDLAGTTGDNYVCITSHGTTKNSDFVTLLICSPEFHPVPQPWAASSRKQQRGGTEKVLSHSDSGMKYWQQ